MAWWQRGIRWLDPRGGFFLPRRLAYFSSSCSIFWFASWSFLNSALFMLTMAWGSACSCPTTDLLNSAAMGLLSAVTVVGVAGNVSCADLQAFGAGFSSSDSDRGAGLAMLKARTNY